MSHYNRPQSYISAGHALTGTSIDELIRPGLQLAFPLPSQDDGHEETFRRLLHALGQRSPQQRQAEGRG